MKICSKKDIKIATGIMAASILLGGCTVTTKPTEPEIKDDPDIKTEINLKDVEDADYDKDLMDAEYRRYCIDLMSQTIKDYGSDDNIMISPASIMFALDMVAAGCKEDSLAQLTDLFAVGQGPLSQQAYAAALMDKINDSRDVEFSCANAIWSNETILGDSINMEYVEYVQDTFMAEYRLEPFSSSTVDEINDWVYEHTDEMIEKIIKELDEETVMVLVNAIAFDGKWADPYEDFQIREGDFRCADGSMANATYLNDYLNKYYETDEATGFIKMYEGGDYAFLAILPTDESISANEFLKNFSAEDYEAFINSATDEYDIITMMPEFEYDFEFLMNDTITSLGCGDVFDSDTADLSGIAGDPGDLFVSKILHKTHIEVDRNGTRAAAVTAIMVDGAMASEPNEQREVFCDRPFAYAIVDTSTMAPIFIGTVNEL